MNQSELIYKIGLKIKALREGKNISQQDLAATCNFEKSNMETVVKCPSNA